MNRQAPSPCLSRRTLGGRVERRRRSRRDLIGPGTLEEQNGGEGKDRRDASKLLNREPLMVGVGARVVASVVHGGNARPPDEVDGVAARPACRWNHRLTGHLEVGL